MVITPQTSRIGTLLLQRKLISRPQLAAAIREQRRCHRRLGEILVDRGVINRGQLRHCLRWQAFMRRTCITAALTLSPLQLTLAESSVDQTSNKLPSMGEVSLKQPVKTNLRDTLKQRFNSPMWTLLKGEYEGGADRETEGLFYRAEWSQESIQFEVKYRF